MYSDPVCDAVNNTSFQVSINTNEKLRKSDEIIH